MCSTVFSGMDLGLALQQQSYVLVVDDDAGIRGTLLEILRDEHVPARGATNGREALAVLRAHPSVAVILLDLMMPEMNGEEFRVQQLADPLLAPVPVVVMTASNLRDLHHLQAAALLRKPFGALEMLSKLAPFLTASGSNDRTDHRREVNRR